MTRIFMVDVDIQVIGIELNYTNTQKAIEYIRTNLGKNIKIEELVEFVPELEDFKDD